MTILFIILFSSTLIIGIYFLRPIRTKWSTCSYIANRFCNRLIEDMCAFTVRVIVYRSVFANTIASCSFNSINICTDEQKLPSVLFFLPLNHFLNLLTCITVACVLLSVSCDNEHRVLRHVLVTGIFVNVSNVVNCSADGINQSRATVNTSHKTEHLGRTD